MPASIFDRLPVCSRSFPAWYCGQPGSAVAFGANVPAESTNLFARFHTKDRGNVSVLQEGIPVKKSRKVDTRGTADGLPAQRPPPPGQTKVFQEPSPKKFDLDLRHGLEQTAPPLRVTKVFKEPSPKKLDLDFRDRLEQTALLPVPTKVFQEPSPKMLYNPNEHAERSERSASSPGLTKALKGPSHKTLHDHRVAASLHLSEQNPPLPGPPKTFQEPSPLEESFGRSSSTQNTVRLEETRHIRLIPTPCTTTSVSHAVFSQSGKVIFTSPCPTVQDFSCENENLVLEYTGVFDRYQIRSSGTTFDSQVDSLSSENGDKNRPRTRSQENSAGLLEETDNPIESDVLDHGLWGEEPEVGSTNPLLFSHSFTHDPAPVGHHTLSFYTPPSMIISLSPKRNSRSAESIPRSRIPKKIPADHPSVEQSKRRRRNAWVDDRKSEDTSSSQDVVATKDVATEKEETVAQITHKNAAAGSFSDAKPVHEDTVNKTEDEHHADAGESSPGDSSEKAGDSSEEAVVDVPPTNGIRSCLTRLPRAPDPTRVKKTVKFSPSVSFSSRHKSRSALMIINQIRSHLLALKSEGPRNDSTIPEKTSGVECKQTQSSGVTGTQQQFQNGRVAAAAESTPSNGRRAPTMYEFFTSQIPARQTQRKTDGKPSAPSEDVMTSSAIWTSPACKPSVKRTSKWRDDLFMLFVDDLDKTVTQLREEGRFVGLTEFDLAATITEFMQLDRLARTVHLPSPAVAKKLELMADLCYIHADTVDTNVTLCKNRESRIPLGRDILWVHTAF